MTPDEVNVIMRRRGLELTDEELDWVSRAMTGYQAQLDTLMALQLDDEEVGTAYIAGLRRE